MPVVAYRLRKVGGGPEQNRSQRKCEASSGGRKQMSARRAEPVLRRTYPHLSQRAFDCFVTSVTDEKRRSDSKQITREILRESHEVTK